MISVYNIYPHPLDRSMTRSEWKKQTSIARLMQRLANITYQENKEEIEKRCMNLLIYGTTHPDAIIDTKAK